MSRILDNEKHVGRWVYNKTASRRDPWTGRRRRFTKPEPEWVDHEDDALRMVPGALWGRIRTRRLGGPGEAARWEGKAGVFARAGWTGAVQAGAALPNAPALAVDM